MAAELKEGTCAYINKEHNLPIRIQRDKLVGAEEHLEEGELDLE